MAKIARKADILVVAIGRAKFVTADFVKEGAVVIDVGMNRDENGKLCGDVDYEQVAPLASHITPVPGGVGPMTITMLMSQTYEAAVRALKKIGELGWIRDSVCSCRMFRKIFKVGTSLPAFFFSLNVVK